jgi:hypothetical protein
MGVCLGLGSGGKENALMSDTPNCRNASILKTLWQQLCTSHIGRTVGPSWWCFAAVRHVLLTLLHSHSHSLGRKRRYETLANPSIRLWEVGDWLALRTIGGRGNGLLLHR